MGLRLWAEGVIVKSYNLDVPYWSGFLVQSFEERAKGFPLQSLTQISYLKNLAKY
jgi:hypothetical protein